MMKNIIEAFSPSGNEEKIIELLKHQLRGVFDELTVDNLGNLIAKSGDGSLCVECGMDTTGVMVVSKADGRAYFAAVGPVKPKELAGRTIVFANGQRGTVGYGEDIDIVSARISDLYIETDTDGICIGEFGAVFTELKEEDGGFVGYGLKHRIGIAAVCEALKKLGEVNNVTVLFSAQKRLGGRGLRTFFESNSFEKIVTVDGCSEDNCVIVAKDEKAVAEKKLRVWLEKITEDKQLDVATVVSQENFCLEQITVSCGVPCAAVGIGVLCEEKEPERVSRSDFENLVLLIEEILKRGAEKCL